MAEALRLFGPFLIVEEAVMESAEPAESTESKEEAKFRHNAISLRSSLILQALLELKKHQPEMNVQRYTEKRGVFSISAREGKDTTVSWQKRAQSDKGLGIGTDTYTLSISPKGEVKSTALFVLDEPMVPVTRPGWWGTITGDEVPHIDHDEWERRQNVEPELRDFPVDTAFLNAFRRDIRDSKSLAEITQETVPPTQAFEPPLADIIPINRKSEAA